MASYPRPPAKQVGKLKFFKYGLPFMLLTVGASFGLKEFRQVRYQYSKTTATIPEKMEQNGVEMKALGVVTIDTEYEKLKVLNIDDWEQKRGPRPWEEASSSVTTSATK